MPVTILDIENFKSYAGKQTIGPFRDFTSVIGPNGSGKSNLMDAISFVLGVQSRDLRSSQMKDLIFRPPGVLKKRQSLKAIVTLHFEDPDTQQEITFGRAISPQGVGEYLVNGKTVTYAIYETKLSDIGVLVKARNFLVFQGDVESIARKSPRDFVALLEQISTSSDCAAEYEAALKAKEEAEEFAREELLRQKGFKSERRLLKEQKEEAERFRNLVDEKAQVQTELYLWQLYHIDSDIREQEETLQELKQELVEKQQEEDDKNLALKAAKDKASKARRRTQELDTARVKAAAALDKLEPQVITTTEEIKNLKKKIGAAEKQLAKKKKDASNHQSILEEIETEVEDHRSQLTQLETDYEEIKRNAAGEEVTLTEEQEEELVRVRQAAAAATVVPRRTLNGLTRKHNAARAKAQTLHQELEDAKKSRTDTQAQVTTLEERKEKLTSSLESTKEEIAEKEKDLVEAQQSQQRSQARREELDAEIEKVNQTLRDAKDSRRKSKDEERVAAAIASLKRHFPGVQGRLVDLCRPTQTRFNLAITVAAGKDMEAIVVDTKETGRECIRHLKEQRIGTATFLPLDSLQVVTAESQERARSLFARDNRFRLAADCITADEFLKPAVLYAVGNTVVCDNLDCAREFCFGNYRGSAGAQQARLKAVTLQGSVISKAGTMTGGVTQDDSNKAGRWGAAEIEKMREKKEQLDTQRSELDGGRGGRGDRRGPGGNGSRIEELKNNLGSLKNKSHYAKSDLGYTNKELRTKQNLVNSLDRQVKKLETDVEKVEAEITVLAQQVVDAREAVMTAEEEHLGPFREKTGLKDLGAYDDAVGERRKDFNEQRRKLMEHIAQLEQKKEYETNRDLEKPVAALEKRIQGDKVKLKKTKEKQAKLEEKVEEAKEELARAEATVKDATAQEEECDEEVQAAQQEYNEAQGDRNKAKKAVNAGESQLERLKGTLHETLQKARVEEVILPMLDEEERDSDDEGDFASSQRSSSREDSNHSLSQSMSQTNPKKIQKDLQAASKVNYSKLDELLKQRPSDREEKRMKKEFEEKLNRLTAEIEAANPNMKVSTILFACFRHEVPSRNLTVVYIRRLRKRSRPFLKS
jgi:structural maintenance of chromosome 1